MATLEKFPTSDYLRLLNPKKLEVAGSGRGCSVRQHQYDTINRTIFIGLGGMGVRTVNQLKREVKKRMCPGWEGYVAFLAVDSDWHDLDCAEQLGGEEKLMITRNGINERFSNRSFYPPAVRQFMPDGFFDPNAPVIMGNMGQAGTNRLRLMGKAKLYDKATGDAKGVDEELVGRLGELASGMAPITGAVGAYEVYVIGGISGGTGGGIVTEMPALIRAALAPLGANVYVNGLLYLPDTVTDRDPCAANALQGSGYATLKELNYYQGMVMRPGYSECFPCSDPRKERTEIADEYFTTLYLIGSRAGGADPKACDIARETVTEFLMNRVTQINLPQGAVMPVLPGPAVWEHQRHFWENPDGRTEEALGEYHQFPLSFTSMGFAEAKIPHKLLRAYQISALCEKAGLHTVSCEERQYKEASGEGSLPFRDFEDFFDAEDAEKHIQKLLAPLKNLLKDLHSGHFTLATQPGFQNMTFGMAKTYNPAQIEIFANKAMEDQAGADAAQDLRKAIREAFDKFQDEIIAFVKMYGPLAFVNLFKGTILPYQDGTPVKGIDERLLLLINGKKFDGRAYQWVSVESAKADMESTRQAVNSTNDSAINRALNAVDHRLDNIKEAWFNACNQYIAARVNKQRREAALGENGLLAAEILTPANALHRRLESFGYLLDALSDVYAEYGRKMEDFSAFAAAAESYTDINLGAIGEAAYRLMKDRADGAMAAVDGVAFRNAVIDHFFAADDNGNANWDRWLDVPDEIYVTRGRGVILLGGDAAIPARHIFEGLADKHLGARACVNVVDVFVEMQNHARQSYFDTARQIITRLGEAAAPLCRVEKVGAPACCLLFPWEFQGLYAIESPIRQAAQYSFRNIRCYPADVDGITLSQQSRDFALYELSDVACWEKDYHILMAQRHKLLHGKSPAQMAFGSGAPGWEEYPDALCQSNSERTRLAKVAETVNEARKLGVLYAQQDEDGKWYICRVHCGPEIDWRFSRLHTCPDAVTGAFPMGRALAEAAAQQNGVTLASVSTPVTLRYAGIYSEVYSCEDEAWEKAAVILRNHVPMYMEVLHTVEKFRVWAEKDV